MLPRCNTDSEGQNYDYKVYTRGDKIVSDYAGISILKARELDFISYLTYLHDGYITKLENTKEGREYLEKCFVLKQTKADREALRRKFGGE